ncbi:MAG: leucine-rich repeat domain-containing protein, partial [Clostridia bacterium]|nr:leucine-rich repeat domain-containing protein [Clostridia bacterium]
MKRNIACFLVLVFALTVLPFSAFTASADTYGDYEYTVLSDGTVEITKYNGNEENVSIPEYIDGKKV